MIDAEAMGSAALFVSDGVAGVYNIVTVPQSGEAEASGQR